MECLRNSQFLRRHLLLVVGLLTLTMAASPALMATVAEATPITPGTTVFPGLVAPGSDPGTLLASLDDPWSFSTTAGTTSGHLYTAVFRESDGFIDFYYQILNDGTSATSIRSESNTNFAAAIGGTGVAYRFDGSGLPNDGTFVWQDGTIKPATADDPNADNSTIGFNFTITPPGNGTICPGCVSNVFIVATNQTTWTNGNAELLDGGSVTVRAFQPGSVPEPASLALIGGGLMLLAGFRKFAKKY